MNNVFDNPTIAIGRLRMEIRVLNDAGYSIKDFCVDPRQRVFVIYIQLLVNRERYLVSIEFPRLWPRVSLRHAVRVLKPGLLPNPHQYRDSDGSIGILCLDAINAITNRCSLLEIVKLTEQWLTVYQAYLRTGHWGNGGAR